jgi:hypothetical protein
MKFEYCECGCKGYECGNYWIFWDLKKSYHVHHGHGWIAPKLATCTSMEEAKDVAKAHLKNKINEELKQLLEE